jgi:hypothetical protein
VLCIMAVAGMVTVRGVDSRLARGARQVRSRVVGPLGLALLVGVAGAAYAYQRLGTGYEHGGYRSTQQEKAADAQWERTWLPRATPFSVEGGEVSLIVDTAARRVTGSWALSGVKAERGHLNVGLPHGVQLSRVVVAGVEARPEISLDQAMIPLGACASSGCEVEMAWVVDGRGWVVGPVPTVMGEAKREPPWISSAGVWLMSARALPQLGLDAHRLMLSPSDRATAGLPPQPGDIAPDASASVDASAPAGAWRWSVTLPQGEERSGTIAGPLRFAVVWAPGAAVVDVDGVRYLSDPTRSDVIEDLAHDVSRMRTCVDRRMGGGISVSEVAQFPRKLGESEVYGDTLLLAEDPHWDIARQGTGRWKRQAAIAELIARQRVLDAANLRQGAGVTWLIEGLPGAIGLLCGGDENGTTALQTLLERHGEVVDAEIGASKTPIVALGAANHEEWAHEYAPLATVSWAARAMPADIEALLRGVRVEGVPSALAAVAGEEEAAEMLGPLRLSDVSVRPSSRGASVIRKAWSQGSWTPDDGDGALLMFSRAGDRLVAREMQVGAVPGKDTKVLYLDERAGYERAVIDNRIEAGH